MDNKELCQWLRENSTGAYRNANLAADVIEHQDEQLKAAREEIEYLKQGKETQSFSLPSGFYLEKF